MEHFIHAPGNGLREHRLIFFEELPARAAAESKEYKGKPREELQQQMEELEADYKAHVNLYELFREPAGAAKALLPQMGDRTPEEWDAPSKRAAEHFKEEYESRIGRANAINIDSPEAFRRDLEAMVRLHNGFERSYSDIAKRQEILKLSLDLVNPDLLAILRSLEVKPAPGIRDKVGAYFSNSAQTKNRSECLKLKGDVLARWWNSDAQKKMFATLGALGPDVEAELVAWAKPQLAPEQLRQYAYELGHANQKEGASREFFAEGMLEHVLANLSADALKNVEKVGGVENVFAKILATFADHLWREKKDDAARRVAAVVKQLQ